MLPAVVLRTPADLLQCTERVGVLASATAERPCCEDVRASRCGCGRRVMAGFVLLDEQTVPPTERGGAERMR